MAVAKPTVKSTSNPKPTPASVNNVAKNAANIAKGDRIKQANAKNAANKSNSSNFEKTFNNYQSQGRLNAPPENNVSNLADLVSKLAKEAAALKGNQQQIQYRNQQDSQSSQFRESSRNRDFQLELQRQQYSQNNSSRDTDYNRAKIDNFNNAQREDSIRKQQQDFQLKMLAESRKPASGGGTVTMAGFGGMASGARSAIAVGGGGGGISASVSEELKKSQEAAQKASEETRLKLRNEANQDADKAVQRGTDAQSRIQRERAEQGLTSQRDATEGNSRLGRERAEQGLRSQQVATDGQSRLQSERTEQTSKLQTQAAAEAAARTAGSRAAAIEAFRKFGKGKGV